jgi:hypothetical protein
MFDWSFAAFVVGLVVLIFLLTLLLSAVSYQPPESNRNTGESDTAQQQARDADYQQFAATIADAIHTYRRDRRDRRADERYRAHRERATIVVLGVTSIFAFNVSEWGEITEPTKRIVATLNPHVQFEPTIAEDVISALDSANVNARLTEMYMWGRVEYDDAFSHPHYIEILFHLGS